MNKNRTRTENKFLRLTDPLLLFPEEVWEIVFEKFVDDRSDPYSCYMSCVTFQRVLKRKRVHVLFSAVAPLIEDYMTYKDLLACRAVCWHWKCGVDKHLQSSEYALKTENYSGNCVPCQLECHRVHPLVTHLDSTNIINMFMERFGNASSVNIRWSNPFPTRIVWFTVNRCEGPVRFWKRADVLLAKFGKHIQTCCVSETCPYESKECHVQTLVCAAPRLRSLRVDYFQQEAWDCGEPELVEDRSGVTPHKMVELYHFPVLHHLERLHIRPWRRKDLTYLTFRSLLKSAPVASVKSLRLDDELWDAYGYWALGEAVHRLHGVEDFFYSGCLPNRVFYQLRNAHWPLKVITLNIPLETSRPDKCLSMVTLVATLNKFGSTLEVLTLQFLRAVGNFGHDEQVRLRLPILHTFSMSARFFARSLNFLVDLKQLRNLTLDTYDGGPLFPNQLVDVCERCPLTLAESSVWTMFHKLEYLNVKKDGVSATYRRFTTGIRQTRSVIKQKSFCYRSSFLKCHPYEFIV